MTLINRKLCCLLAGVAMGVGATQTPAFAKDSLFGAYVELFGGLSVPRDQDISLNSDIVGFASASTLKLPINVMA